MGQKLSDLRGYMLTMDQNGVTDGAKIDGQNGNAPEGHFDDIYGTVGQGESSSSPDEVNGNDLHSEDCTAEVPCTCGPAKSRGCRKKDEAGPSKRAVRNTNGKKSRPKRNKETSSTKKKPNWGLRLNCARTKSDADLPDSSHDGCVCTGYKRTEPPAPSARDEGCLCGRHRCGPSPQGPAIDLALFNPADFPMEDADERARYERAREMAEGVDPPPGFVPHVSWAGVNLENLEGLEGIAAFFQARMGLEPRVALSALSHIDMLSGPPRLHSQADFIHCLVPDLMEITKCSYYWGKMDRYEADRLLEGRPEGTFLLRDSAQEEHLFSVSFRKYERSLHARIEQWNHKFSFDSHDPGVFSSPTVVGLIEHYKDPSYCMFFEPMLTIPLHRSFAFPLQHLCRAVICSSTNYDAVNRLPLPRSLKQYLREYHYRQRLRIRYLDYDI